MSNSSKFPIYLELGLEKKDDNVFAVFPPTLEIKEGDTKEVKVWANPRRTVSRRTPSFAASATTLSLWCSRSVATGASQS